MSSGTRLPGDSRDVMPQSEAGTSFETLPKTRVDLSIPQVPGKTVKLTVKTAATVRASRWSLDAAQQMKAHGTTLAVRLTAQLLWPGILDKNLA